VRFQPATGRAWHGVREGMADFELKPAVEKGAIGAGPFALEVVALEAHVVRLYRVDERSGRAWTGEGLVRRIVDLGFAEDEEDDPPPPPDADARWEEMAEPEAPVERAQPAAAGGSGPYVLRAVGARGGAFVTRLQRDTGRTWLAADPTWALVPEEAPPGPGRYELAWALVPKVPPTLLRFDATSGRAWSFQATANEQRWSLVPEAEGSAPLPVVPVTAERAGYGWLVGQSPGIVAVLRCDPRTGRLWIVRDDWTLFAEGQAPPASEYVFRLIPGTDALPPLPVRLDARSGRLWLTPDGRSLVEVDPGVEGAPGGARFDVRVAAHGREVHVARWDRVTGAVALFDGESRMQPIADPAPIGRGDYDLQLCLSGTGRPFLLRLDRVTGRWWTVTSGRWRLVLGASEAVAGGSVPRFTQQMLGAESHMVAARIDERTGRVDHLEPTDDDPARWRPTSVPELHAPPQGSYALGFAVRGGERRGKSASVTRMDRATGRLWVPGHGGPQDALVWMELR
jgi:hypothetical protein